MTESMIQKEYMELILKHGSDILESPGMESEKRFIQHGQTSVYMHSLLVAAACIDFSRKYRISVNERALVRGALLHDYFLYDWHVPDKSHSFHAFTHAGRALKNAEKDFELNEIERNMIESHMFPLGLAAPIYRESLILCISDKLCAAEETVSGFAAFLSRIMRIPQRAVSEE